MVDCSLLCAADTGDYKRTNYEKCRQTNGLFKYGRLDITLADNKLLQKFLILLGNKESRFFHILATGDNLHETHICVLV